MKQLYHIIRREILVKFKNYSFYLFALITPLLFVLPAIFSVFSGERTGKIKKTDKVGIICNQFPYDTLEYRNLKLFAIDSHEADSIKNGSFDYTDFIGVIDMQDASFDRSHDAMCLQIYTSEDHAALVQQHLNDIESFVNSEYVYQYSVTHGGNSNDLLKLANFVKIIPVYDNAENNVVHTRAQIMAFGLGMLLYIMLILFNNNIVKSISEEKANKLAEILSMIVTPRKLMIGKIIGLALASIVQLVLWIIAFTVYNKFVMVIGLHYGYGGTVNSIYGADFCAILFAGPFMGWLLLFFFLGVLLNGTLSTIFAICSSNRGSSVPMILSNMLNLLSIYFCMYAATNPNSDATVFASYFPITSYLVMPAILPFGVSLGHILLSAILLFVVSILLLLMTGKLYRRFLV